MAEHDQRFDTFQQWVNKASSWLTRRGEHVKVICFDQKGRLVSNGGDMMRARDEGAFPVEWVWPEQAVEAVMKARSTPTPASPPATAAESVTLLEEVRDVLTWAATVIRPGSDLRTSMDAVTAKIVAALTAAGQATPDPRDELIADLRGQLATLQANYRNVASAAGKAAPIPMILHCPKCGEQHIDEPDERTPGWTNPPHRSHLCHGCQTIWRPADVPTVGVRSIETRGKADTWAAGQAATPSAALNQLLLECEAVARLASFETIKRQGGIIHIGLSAQDIEAVIAHLGGQAATPSEPADAWRPIETAPDHGFIQVWCPEDDSAREAYRNLHDPWWRNPYSGAALEPAPVVWKPFEKAPLRMVGPSSQGAPIDE